MHSLALALSTEIACWGIETTIVVPGQSTDLLASCPRPGELWDEDPGKHLYVVQTH